LHTLARDSYLTHIFYLR